MLRYEDIPKFPVSNYKTSVPLDSLESELERFVSRGLDMNPDFQRGHVWTREQQIAFME